MRTAGAILAGCLALCLAAPAAAGPLESYLAELRSLQADFEQLVRSPAGADVERLEGRMSLLRPGRFRWEVRSPYRQLIVVDAEFLWFYDPELEQVSVQGIDEALAHTPAALLIGTVAPLRYFDIAPAREAADGSLEVGLLPREEWDDYRGLRLRFMDGELTGIAFTDALDRRVEVRFSAIRRNRAGVPAAAEFRFVPPAGVDVIDLSSARSAAP